MIDRIRESHVVDVDFLSPILSTLLAASRIHSPIDQCVRLSTRAASYARTIGLEDALQGRRPRTRSEPGRTYSALTRLDSAEAVETCSEVINDFVYAQLGDEHRALAIQVARVIGELHDNVASHARGVGFSAAQRNGTTLVLAISDAGCGMLFNVRRSIPQVTTHGDAIRWCLERGNTTAAVDEVPGDPPAQWLPEDALANPYPAGLPTRRDANHHLGEGLWLLAELVRASNGSLWIWSGDAHVLVDARSNTEVRAPRDWAGVAIEIALPLVAAGVETAGSEKSQRLEELARRLGL